MRTSRMAGCAAQSSTGRSSPILRLEVRLRLQVPPAGAHSDSWPMALSSRGEAEGSHCACDHPCSAQLVPCHWHGLSVPRCARNDRLEQGELLLGALDLEQAALGAVATRGGEAAELTVGSDDPVARYDQRERVMRQGLANLAGQRRVAEALGNLAVRQGRAGLNGPSHAVHPLLKLGHAVHVQGNRAEVAGLASQEALDGVDRLLDLGWCRRWLGLASPNLNAGDAARTPADAAVP